MQVVGGSTLRGSGGGGHICLLSEFQIWKCGHLVFQGVSHAPVGI